MGQSRYPTTMWGFTEVTGSDRTEGWNARFWTISFNDRTVEVVFDKVGLLDLNSKTTEPRKALLDYLSRHRSG